MLYSFCHTLLYTILWLNCDKKYTLILRCYILWMFTYIFYIHTILLTSATFQVVKRLIKVCSTKNIKSGSHSMMRFRNINYEAYPFILIRRIMSSSELSISFNLLEHWVGSTSSCYRLNLFPLFVNSTVFLLFIKVFVYIPFDFCMH